MSDYVDDIEHELKESMLVLEKTQRMSQVVSKAVEAIVSSYKNKGKLIVFGNGGSAADSQHIAGELVSKFYLERAALNAVALTVNTSILTAIGNDSSFDDVFSRQVEAIAQKNDVVLAISTSGNSKNVINGLKAAKKIGCTTIGMTGESGGKMKSMPDILINVPSGKTPRVQEAHIAIAHIICGLVEKELFA